MDKYTILNVKYDEALAEIAELDKRNEDDLEDNMGLRSQIDQAEKLWRRQGKEINEQAAHIERLREAKSCNHCPDIGYTVIHGYHGEPEQEQCEFCYTDPNSLFNVRNSTPAQSLKTIQADAIEKMAINKIKELEATLTGDKYQDVNSTIKLNLLTTILDENYELRKEWLDIPDFLRTTKERQ